MAADLQALLKLLTRVTASQHNNIPTRPSMSTEKTAFRAEVAEVERWWKVCSISFFVHCGFDLITPL